MGQTSSSSEYSRPFVFRNYLILPSISSVLIILAFVALGFLLYCCVRFLRMFTCKCLLVDLQRITTIWRRKYTELMVPIVSTRQFLPYMILVVPYLAQAKRGCNGDNEENENTAVSAFVPMSMIVCSTYSLWWKNVYAEIPGYREWWQAERELREKIEYHHAGFWDDAYFFLLALKSYFSHYCMSYIFHITACVYSFGCGRNRVNFITIVFPGVASCFSNLR